MKLFCQGHPEVVSGVPFETMSSSNGRLNDQELASTVFIDVIGSTILNRNLNFVIKNLIDNDVILIILSFNFSQRLLKFSKSLIHLIFKNFVTESLLLTVLELGSSIFLRLFSFGELSKDSLSFFLVVQFMIN